MIGTFRQQQSAGELIRLLSSRDENIRLAAIRSLRMLNASEAETRIMEIYSGENSHAQTEILKTLEVIGSPRSSSFLEKILYQQPASYPLAIQAVRALLALGEAGAAAVEKIYRESGQEMQLIINHAKDKRL
jgi:HEAT repeat protein